MQKKFALIGHPLEHSFSPLIHKIAFRYAGINADYSSVDISPSAFDVHVIQLKDKQYDGFNITIPYKSKIFKHLDLINREAEITGAVNTVNLQNNSWFGCNTDIGGFLYPLRKLDKEFRYCVILGNGGAARAVIMALLREYKPQTITILARSIEKSVRIKTDFAEVSPHTKLIVDYIDNYAEYLGKTGLLINATPCGMWPKVDSSPLPAEYDLKDSMVVYDLIYNPLKTKFLTDAKRNNKSSLLINGLQMLVAQALLSINLWTGIEIAVESILPLVEKELPRLNRK